MPAGEAADTAERLALQPLFSLGSLFPSEPEWLPSPADLQVAGTPVDTSPSSSSKHRALCPSQRPVPDTAAKGQVRPHVKPPRSGGRGGVGAGPR